MGKMKKEKTIVINNVDQPELYDQLEKIEERKLHKMSFDTKAKFFGSKEDYLESLVKLDKAINGNHINEIEKNIISFVGEYSLDYSSIPLGSLNTLLFEKIDNLDEIINKIYEEFPIELSNAKIQRIGEYNEETGGYPVKSYFINDKEHKNDCWYFSKDDLMSKIFYNIGYIKILKEELVNRGTKTISYINNSDLPIKYTPSNFIDVLKETQDTLDKLCGSEADISSEYRSFAEVIIKEIKLPVAKRQYFNFALYTLECKMDGYIAGYIGNPPFYISDVEEDELEIEKALLKVMLAINVIFVKNYLIALKDEKNPRFNPFDFNTFLKFIIEYYSGSDDKGSLMGQLVERHNTKDLNALKEILEECKDLIPYARRAYEKLF